MLDDSMPLLPPLNDVGIKLAGANEDAAVSEKSMPLLVGRWQQDTCDQKAGKSRIGGPTSTFTKLLATGRHSFMEGTLVILKGLTALQCKRSDWQDFEKLHNSITTGEHPNGPD